jgi:hypothetical protein
MITEDIAENSMTEDDCKDHRDKNQQIILKYLIMEKIAPETFGGIEFVRVSSLPENKKIKFWQSPISKKVIMILRGKELLSDCICYKDYCDFEFSNLTSH